MVWEKCYSGTTYTQTRGQNETSQITCMEMKIMSSGKQMTEKVCKVWTNHLMKCKSKKYFSFHVIVHICKLLKKIINTCIVT